MKVKKEVYIGLAALLPLLLLATKRKKVNVLYAVDDLTKHATLRYDQRNLNDIEQIVIHHSAQSNGDPFQYAAYHVKTHGWAGIGYHYVIQKDGLIFQTQQLETVSYHARNCNENSIGICLTGNYNVEQVPIEQLEALYGLIDEIKRTLRRNLLILPHHDCTSTDCPGKNMPIDQIEKRGIGAVTAYKISKKLLW
jgi:N-acetyl-anhydromuramyl-L-alanine amidase AmpD